MSIEYESVKLTATPSVSGWIQVHEFTPQDPEKLDKRGKIFAVIATKKHKEGIEAVSLGREIITRLHEEYYKDETGDAYLTLQKAVKKVSQEFISISPEIGVGVLVDDKLYVVGVGGIEADLIRRKSLVSLLQTREEAVGVSGKPEDGDVFVLGTKSFFENFEKEEVKEILIGENFENSSEEFAPKIHASPNLGSAGFLAIKFGTNKPIDIEKIEEEKVESQQSEIQQPLYTQVQPVTEEKKEDTTQNQPGQSLLGRFSRPRLKLRRTSFNEASPQGRKTTLTVGIILLSLLVISVFFGLDQKKKKDLEKEYGTKLQSAISDYDKSLEVFDLDVDKSRELFLSSKEKLDQVLASEYHDARISDLENKIKENQGRILGEVQADVQEYLDLTLQTSGFSGSELSSSGETIFVLDKENKQIIKVEIDSKKASIASGSDDVEEAKALGSYEDRYFVLRDDGIYELTDGEDKVIDKGDWENPLIYFYSANLYLLNKGKNSILRYSGSDGGFSEGKEWLAPGIEADFSRVVDMTIDGSIWLLSSSGKVSRFTLGSPQNVSLEGLPENLSDPTAIYTNEDLENVYVLDASQSRIVVLEKNGKFKVQYKADEIKQAKDLVVSEKEGKIILLTGSKLESIDI